MNRNDEPRSYKGYREPEAIASDPRLSPSGRRSLLLNWEWDLRQHLQAGDENMLGLPGSGAEESDLLQRVRLCLRELEAPASAKPQRMNVVGPLILGVF